MTEDKRLGWFTRLVGDEGRDAGELYRDALAQFVLAEELGFDVGWVAQHHVDPAEGGLPSPFVFLAHAAARLSVIRLGTAIVTLGLEDPVRVAEDAAVLDALSGGRSNWVSAPAGRRARSRCSLRRTRTDGPCTTTRSVA